jgi:hypothetical protein
MALLDKGVIHLLSFRRWPALRIASLSACDSRKPFQLRDDTIQFLDDEAGTGLTEDLDEPPVVPERTLPAAVETLPPRPESVAR